MNLRASFRTVDFACMSVKKQGKWRKTKTCFLKIPKSRPVFITCIKKTAMCFPDRLFLSSAAVDHDADSGVPPRASPCIVMGAAYTLVSVLYLIFGGNHFVSQFRVQGAWFMYDSASTAAAPYALLPLTRFGTMGVK